MRQNSAGIEMMSNTSNVSSLLFSSSFYLFPRFLVNDAKNKSVLLIGTVASFVFISVYFSIFFLLLFSSIYFARACVRNAFSRRNTGKWINVRSLPHFLYTNITVLLLLYTTYITCQKLYRFV